MKHSIATLIGCLSFVMILMESVFAAKLGVSESHFTVTPERIDGEVSIHWQDLANYFPLDDNGDGVLEELELAGWRDGLKALCETFFTLWIGEDQVQLDTESVVLDPLSNLLIFKTRYLREERAFVEAFDIAFVAMEDLGPSHAHDLTVTDTGNNELFHEVFRSTPGAGNARPTLDREQSAIVRRSTMMDGGDESASATESSPSPLAIGLVALGILIPAMAAWRKQAS